VIFVIVDCCVCRALNAVHKSFEHVRSSTIDAPEVHIYELWDSKPDMNTVCLFGRISKVFKVILDFECAIHGSLAVGKSEICIRCNSGTKTSFKASARSVVLKSAGV